MAFKLAEAFIRLFTDDRDLKAGFLKAEKDTSAFTAKMGSALGSIARIAFPAGIAAGILAAGKSAIDYADNMGKAAARTGVAAAELSKWTYAAELADVSSEQLAMAFMFINRNAAQAVGGNKELAKSFATVGVKARELARMRPDQILKAVADGLAAIENPTLRGKLAMDLLGRSGQQLMPLLQDVAGQGFGTLAKEAENLGRVVDEKTAKSADEFNDNLTRLKFTISAGLMPAVKSLLPALESLSTAGVREGQNQFVKNWINPISLFTKAAQGVSAIVVTIIGAFKQLGGVAGAVLEAIAATAVALVEGRFKDALDAITTEMHENVGSELDRVAIDMEQKWETIFGLDAREDALREDPAAAVTPITEELKQAVIVAEELEADLRAMRAATPVGLLDEAIALGAKRRDIVQTQIDSMRANGPVLVDEWEAILLEMGDAVGIHGRRLSDLAAQAGFGMADALGESFFNVLTGDLDELDEIWKDFFKSLLREIVQFMAQKAVLDLLKMFGGRGGKTGSFASSFHDFLKGSWGMADGGVVPGGFRAFASGGIVREPTLGLVGEGRYNEAVIPLPDGRTVPVDMRGAGPSEIVVPFTIKLDPLGIASAVRPLVQPTEGEIVATIGANIARNGALVGVVRQAVGK